MVGGSNVDTSKAMALLWVAFTHVSTALHYVMLILSFVIKKEGGEEKNATKKMTRKKKPVLCIKIFLAYPQPNCHLLYYIDVFIGMNEAWLPSSVLSVTGSQVNTEG